MQCTFRALLHGRLRGLCHMPSFLSSASSACQRKQRLTNININKCLQNSLLKQGTQFRYYSHNFLELEMEDPKIPSNNKVIVRRTEGMETMNISFNFQGKDYNLMRGQSETLERTFTRISHNFKKLAEKTQKKAVKRMKKGVVPENAASAEEFVPLVSIPECSIIHDENKLLTLDVENRDAWVDGAIFQIGNLGKFDVYVNVPAILKLKLPSYMLADCPMFPLLETEFAVEEQCQFLWYSEVDSESGLTNDENDSFDQKWQLVSHLRVFTPSSELIGKRLLLKCTPTDGERQGETVEVISSSRVVKGPENVPFVQRHKSTTERATGKQFRVVSYNLLADVYADSDFARDFLFLHCPPEFLAWDYRQQLLLKEIVGYNGDILCLQEVDKGFFTRSLQMAMDTVGLDGAFFGKSGGIAEGEALFYNRERYRLIGQHDIVLSDKLKDDPANADLHTLITKAPKFLENFTTRSSVAQVIALDDISNPGKRMIVANTHLYFHPNANHVRMVQTLIILRHLQQLQAMYNEQDPGIQCSVLFVGDLNSNLKSGAYQLISTGTVPANSAHWFTGGREEFCGGMDLAHDMQLRSVCPEVPYTNYVPGFMDTIDHVVYSEDTIGVHRVVPMPSHEEVTRLTALPNEVFPSDHLPLVCDLRWLA